MPANWCPFCPGSGHVPDYYDVFLYPNDFPAFDGNDPVVPAGELYSTSPAPGRCDVVLYSPIHTQLPSQLSVDHWRKVVDLWTSRSAELFALPEVQYVAVFENSGEAIGVTMPHPHGQIYAIPFIPPQMETEEANASAWRREHGIDLYDAIPRRELDDGTRVVARCGNFVAFVPFFARFPTEVHIYSLRDAVRLSDLTLDERQDFAAIISLMRRKYDALYGFLMPMMMVIRQFGRLRVEFLPIQRSATKLKYLASIETAHGTFLNDTSPEDQAAALRAVVNDPAQNG
jgi:UDPglucose--hexose-1-phosphate uridylyltransferase